MKSPYGGVLQDLLLRDSYKNNELIALASTLPFVFLNERQLCDLELIMNGGFSPLTGFMGKSDYDSVVSNMRLSDGTLFPIPIYLDISSTVIKNNNIQQGSKIALRNPQDNEALAIITVSDIYMPDREKEAESVYGKNYVKHPSIHALFNSNRDLYIGGDIEAIKIPEKYDFIDSRHSPRTLRNIFTQLGWNNVAAFQTRNPMHRAHFELTRIAQTKYNANILLHPGILN